MIEDKI